MYLCKIKQFNLCFYKLCSLIPMNIDKLIVNCVVDNHTVETYHNTCARQFWVNCVVDNHTVETILSLMSYQLTVNCVVDIFWTNENIFWSIPETISYGIYWNSSFLLILGWETDNRDVGKKHLKKTKSRVGQQMT